MNGKKQSKRKVHLWKGREGREIDSDGEGEMKRIVVFLSEWDCYLQQRGKMGIVIWGWQRSKSRKYGELLMMMMKMS